nr:retrovirus-related Pol polyprotein from transposon TNT 1-94 [Tanacetum cinerariifolium]
MTTPTVTSSTDSQMHNNIMVAGSRDHPSMLTTGRYPQWRSRFLRYIDTRPNAIPEHTTVETLMNMSLANKSHFESEKEAIHLILTRIGDEIYSTVDACQKAQEMWEAIERLRQGESLNIQDVKTNLFWEFGKEIAKPITTPYELAFEEDIDPEQARRDKDMQNNLALIVKQFGNQRTMNVAGARENAGSPVVQQSGIQCFNCKEFGHFAKECRKPKRVKDFAYHKEKMLMYKQAEKGVPLQAEQYDWLAEMDEEIDEMELEAHYSYMAKIQEVPTANTGTDSEPLEQVKMILDIMYMCEVDQNDVESDDERVALANLIANLKLDVDENKKIQKQLKKANTTLAQTESEKYKAFNNRTIDYDKLERKLNETLGQLAQKDIEIKEDVLAELQCLYLHKVKECDCLAQKLLKQTESVRKEVHIELLQHFANVEKHSISLEIALPKKEQIVQLILFIANTGCTKHMTGNLKLLCNFVEKFLGIVRFGNDQFAPILGYGDLVQGNITINRVYYVKGLNQNLFSVSQFCDADLEVAFQKSTCFVRDLQGNDLLTDNCGSDLYTISLQESTSSSPICLMAKASLTQAWLWHRRLSHLNFDNINLLSKKDVVIGLPQSKFVKD